MEKLQTYRITLPILNNAANVLFLVSGEDKAARLSEVIDGERGRFPAQAINPISGSLTWLLDTGAASKLQQS